MTRVLYVEDEPILAISTEGLLERNGFTVQLAFDGEDGLAKAEQFRPDVIVTDYMMPRMDGLAMLEKLRGAGVNAPVVLTTAVPQDKLTLQLRNHGGIYVGKPFSDNSLISAIRRAAATLDE